MQINTSNTSTKSSLGISLCFKKIWNKNPLPTFSRYVINFCKACVKNSFAKPKSQPMDKLLKTYASLV